MGNWIPVTKRLPEENCVVLITVKSHGKQGGKYVTDALYVISDNFPIDEYDYNGPGFYVDCGEEDWYYVPKIGEVLAWMPIPEPY